MPLITRFDPWQSSLCTCPPKLTLNPYTGCSHGCVYCYATSYTPHFVACKPKKDLLKHVECEAAKLNGETLSIANSSDPYPHPEVDLGLTRKCLKILSRHNCRIQIVTKSNLVTRDVDILAQVPCTVALTITTEDDERDFRKKHGISELSMGLQSVNATAREAVELIADVKKQHSQGLLNFLPNNSISVL